MNFFFVENLSNDLRAYVDIKTDDLNFTHPVVLENKERRLNNRQKHNFIKIIS